MGQLKIWGDPYPAGPPLETPLGGNTDSSRVKMLINFCMWEVDRIGLRTNRRSCVARVLERGRYAVNKFKGAVSMKIASNTTMRPSVRV